MLNRIIDWSLQHRFVVVLLSLVLVGAGLRALYQLPSDAVPDTTPVQVQVNTTASSGASTFLRAVD